MLTIFFSLVGIEYMYSVCLLVMVRNKTVGIIGKNRKASQWKRIFL